MKQSQRLFPDAEYDFVYNAQLLSLTCFGPSQITLSQTIHMHRLKVSKDQNVLGYKGVGL